MAISTDGAFQSRARAAGAAHAFETRANISRRTSDSDNEPSSQRRKLAHSALELELDQNWFSRIDREVLSNVVACAGAAMADPLMSLVDTAFVGRLGLVQLAALGPNGALFNVIYFLCFTPLAVLCTQNMAAANSRGDAEGLGRGFVQALAAMLMVSTVLVVVLVAATEPVLRLFQTNDEVMVYARTYCSIRALSLPAALTMAVCQAAFRSLLDLRTPFLVVMTSSAANLILDELFMFRIKGGIAGCGWASVLSQYIGAVMFCSVIWARRHEFGLPAALSSAPARYSACYGTSVSGLLPRFYGGGAPVPVTARAAAQQLLPPLVPSSGGGAGGAGIVTPYGRRGAKMKMSDDGLDHGGRVASHAGHGQQQQQQQAVAHRSQGLLQQGEESADFEQQHWMQGGHAAASAGPVAPAGSGSLVLRGHGAQHSNQYSGGGMASIPGSQPSSGRSSRCHTASPGPPSSPRQSYEMVPEAAPLLGGPVKGTAWIGSWQQLGTRLGMLLLSLDWRDFGKRFAALTARGLLILSTYTGASVVAARQGTKMMAGHQVVQQQQQLQMSVAWSFLHVGQSMVANLFHTPQGIKPARKLATRIIRWAATTTALLALLTWVFQHRLSGVFVRDASVLELVRSAAVPATLMLAISWNNAVEGCLLGADENAYVVRVYPLAVAGCLIQLVHTVVKGSGLTGVWWGLFIYYLGLLLGFANRFWFNRGHI